MAPHGLHQALSSGARTAATFGAIGDADPAIVRGAHVDVTESGTMAPHGLYQALSSNARTAATLAPSVMMLTRPSSEVPMLSSQREAPWRRTVCIRPLSSSARTAATFGAVGDA